MKTSLIKKRLLGVIVISCVAGTVLFLLHLWFEIFSSEIMAKIFVTCAVFAVIPGVVYALISDMKDEEEQKDKGLIE